MKTIFAKYNRDRLPKFQTVTKIVELDDSSRLAIKQALASVGKEHIAEIHANYTKLTTRYSHINLVKPILEDDLTISFHIAPGDSFEKLLNKAFEKQDRAQVFALLDKFIVYLDSFVTQRQVKFEACNKFKQIFGDWTIDDPQDFIELANIDMIFSNLFVTVDGQITQIDYEWVFDFPVPKKYIIFISIYDFFFKHNVILNDFTRAEILSFLGFLSDEYNKILLNYHIFQKYVFGLDNQFTNNLKVLKPQTRLIDDILKKYPKDSYMQLFYYQNGEINVQDSSLFYFDDEKQNKFIFTLPEIDNLTHIRIDLTNFPVVANLEYVKIICSDASEQIVLPCHTNATIIENTNYTYLHNDPINIYEISSLNLNMLSKVEVCVDLYPIKQSEIWGLSNEMASKLYKNLSLIQNELSATQNELSATQNELSATQNELSATKNELSATKNELSATKNELSMVFNSHSWMLTKPLRNVGKTLKSILKFVN